MVKISVVIIVLAILGALIIFEVLFRRGKLKFSSSGGYIEILRTSLVLLFGSGLLSYFLFALNGSMEVALTIFILLTFCILSATILRGLSLYQRKKIKKQSGRKI